MKPAFRNINLYIILCGDALLVAAAYWGAYLIRFEGLPPWGHRQAFAGTIFWILPLFLACFAIFSLYRGMWRYTSVLDSFNLFKAVATASAAAMLVVLLAYRFDGFSRSVFIIHGLLVFLLVGGLRVFIRLLHCQPKGLDPFSLFRKSSGARKRLLIIGAGSAGEKLIRELQENKGLEYDIAGLIDDSPSKYRQRLHGVSVLGNVDQIGELVDRHQVDEIAIAIPSASRRKMRRIIDACKKSQAAYKTVPGIGEIIQGRVALSRLREIRYEDLLRRSPTPIDNDIVCRYLTAQRVMVTGGAGSIGSELCRQIAAFSPRKLIIVERNESALYELALDIQSAFPELEVVSALAAVQNRDRMEHVFSRHDPQVVFHAAAYKHVPMMEIHPWEAIFNNVVGSRVVLTMCRQFAVDRCVMVSTDKAVRPTNVMGATKRFVELLTQSHAAACGTRYMAVRFGNVLGSVGSVLPLFQKQIAAGGPVTVTDPRMTRFFMTIPEA
jgi:FlaA1/EpsC-like NDP-sugar epimerase